jgi:hypothetical protein
MGYDAPGRRAFFLLILPIFLSVSLFLIADIDSPRRGIILVEPHNLESLAESLALAIAPSMAPKGSGAFLAKNH